MVVQQGAARQKQHHYLADEEKANFSQAAIITRPVKSVRASLMREDKALSYEITFI